MNPPQATPLERLWLGRFLDWFQPTVSPEAVPTAIGGDPIDIVMIRTESIPCILPKAAADALNRESGRVYTDTLVWHYRIYRRTGVWLSPAAAERWGDFRSGTMLHAHSRDAAQQGFYQACKTAKACRAAGREIHYPHKQKFYRTTVWKSTGIRVGDGVLLLARARGLEPISVPWTGEGTLREVRLVYDLKQKHYFWHLVVEDECEPTPTLSTRTAAIDLGEIHPVAITDGQEVCILSCRQLRSIVQQTNKELAALQKQKARCQRGSRRSRRLNRARRKLLARQKRRRRDLEHKISRATIDWCQEQQIGVLAIGDVRDVADKTKVKGRLKRPERQKVSNWSHGTIRRYLGYKAEAAGISVHDRVAEHHTSQTCPACGHRHKPRGRVFRCPACGFVFPRDGVGCANLLSRVLYEELARVRPITAKYRKPFRRWYRDGLRSPADTRHVANES
jgi:putative transposase